MDIRCRKPGIYSGNSRVFKGFRQSIKEFRPYGSGFQCLGCRKPGILALIDGRKPLTPVLDKRDDGAGEVDSLASIVCLYCL